LTQTNYGIQKYRNQQITALPGGYPGRYATIIANIPNITVNLTTNVHAIKIGIRIPDQI